MGKIKFILCLLSYLALFSFATPFSVLAIEYGGIGGRPAFPRSGNPDSIFIHEIQPGQTIEEGINVVNNTPEEKTLQIYATDETPSTDGGFACEQLSEIADDVGTWIDLEKNEVTLSSISSEIIPFTITAPEFVDVGEHNGCILIQEKKAQTDDAGLKLSFRTGVRVALTIPGEIIKLLNIIGFTVVDKDESTYLLSSTIENGGNTSVDANIKVIVNNILTKETTEFGGNYAVLRNNPLVVNFDFPKPFWGGKYSAKTIVTYNDGTDEKILESHTIQFISWPQKQALIYLSLAVTSILLFIALILFLKWRRRRKLKNWYDYTVRDSDTLATLVKDHNVSWKEIVKVNKLKPPYELKTGQKVKLPFF